MQFVEVPDFLVNATNVYRTNGYIVRQELLLHDDEEQGTHLFSRDTYFLCTPKRDREYEEVFADSGRYNAHCGKGHCRYSALRDSFDTRYLQNVPAR